jgi:FkbM family methyltransferase
MFKMQHSPNASAAPGTGKRDIQSVASQHAWARAKRRFRRVSWLFKIRPQPLGAALGDLLLGCERRMLVETPAGIKLHLDPLSHLGARLLQYDTYEPGTEAIFRKYIGEESVVVDVGANEGYFSILAAKLSPRGHVFAIEPQQRCVNVLRRNIEANALHNCSIVDVALGKEDGLGKLLLMPSINTGASSLVRTYRFSKRQQAVRMVAATSLFADTKAERWDFVKVDVEGYEAEVVEGLLPLVRRNKIGVLLLDYHPSILAQRGIDAGELHRHLLEAGMHATGEQSRLYKVYTGLR